MIIRKWKTYDKSRCLQLGSREPTFISVTEHIMIELGREEYVEQLALPLQNEPPSLFDLKEYEVRKCTL